MFSGAKTRKPIIIYPFEVTWISAERSNKQHVKKFTPYWDVMGGTNKFFFFKPNAKRTEYEKECWNTEYLNIFLSWNVNAIIT